MTTHDVSMGQCVSYLAEKEGSEAVLGFSIQTRPAADNVTEELSAGCLIVQAGDVCYSIWFRALAVRMCAPRNVRS